MEEPPEKTLFILIAERQEQIISTILSRTQIVKVPALDDQSLAATLNIRFGYSEDQIRPVLNNASGNVNQAIQTLEESISGDFSSGEFREWMLMCFKGQHKKLNDFVSKTSRISRVKQKQLLSYGLNLSRNCLLRIYGRIDLLAIADDEEKEFVNKISHYLNEKNALAYVGLFEEAINHIERNGNASIILMDVSIKAGKLLQEGV